MELWIRSQDKKKLHSVKHLELDNNETGIFIADTYTLLGKYATKERALEVLDEIEKVLHPFVYLDNGIITDSSNGMIYRDKKTNQLIEFSTYVYEMPEE